MLGDEGSRVRALKLKKMAMDGVTEGGKRDVVLKNFAEWVKSRQLIDIGRSSFNGFIKSHWLAFGMLCLNS